MALTDEQEALLKVFAIALGASLIVSLVFSYFIWTAAQERMEAGFSSVNESLAALSGNVATGMSQLKTDLKEEDRAIAQALGRQIEENKANAIKSLIGLDEKIDAVAEQSDVKLDELKTEISGIGSADFSGIAEKLFNSVVTVYTDTSIGSGVIINADGLIVTNYHVISGSLGSVRVRYYGGKSYAAELIGADETYDIALLSTSRKANDWLEFVLPEDVRVGERVAAVGSPQGLEFSISDGIVSSVAREISCFPGHYIQTTAAINPGNSGGPLVNKTGKIIGITSFKVREQDNLGFAIPSDMVLDSIEQIFIEKERLENAG